MKSRRRAGRAVEAEDVPGGLDNYPTPPAFTRAIMPHFRPLPGPIWECACGSGSMAVTLKGMYPKHQIVATTLEDQGYGKSGIDFLTTQRSLAPSMLTNPPFSKFADFVGHALELKGLKRFGLLVKTEYLGGSERMDRIYRLSPPNKVIQIANRMPNPYGYVDKKGKHRRSSFMFFHAWMLWDKDVPIDVSLGDYTKLCWEMAA